MGIPLDVGLVGTKFEPSRFKYNFKDVIIYALGVGAQPSELDYLYENAKLQVYPGFAVVPVYPVLPNIFVKAKVNLMTLLHGEHKIILHRAIPRDGELITTPEITAVYDKEKAAVLVVTARTTLTNGEPVFDNIALFFCRGQGGFGGDRGPETEKLEPPHSKEPDFMMESATIPIQPFIFRLSGDLNPLHVDPNFARLGGFERPIFHGLGTFGYSVRAVVQKICQGKSAKLKSFSARMSKPVYPGEIIITKGWKKDKGQYILQTETNTGNVVLTNALAEIEES